MSWNPWLGYFVQACGGFLIALGLWDVFMTVLYARLGTGPISHRLAELCWALFRRMARPFPKWKTTILAYCGPVYLVLLLCVWVGLLVLGFTLIAWPAMGSAIKSSIRPTPPGFFAAFHYAGGSMTTVGSVDLRPQNGFFQFLTVIDSIIGISVLTLVVTYFIQIYAALQTRNAMVLSLHHASAGTGDAAVLLGALGSGDDFTRSLSEFSTVAGEVTSVFESHHFYSVLIYFRFSEPYYALARGTLLLMEMVTLIESALDDEKHGWLKGATATLESWEGGMRTLTMFADAYLPSGGPAMDRQSEGVIQCWRERYRAAMEYLRSHGISVVHDEAHGEDRYVQLRRQWDPYVMAFAHYLEHPIEEIDPAGTNPRRTALHREMPNPPLHVDI